MATHKKLVWRNTKLSLHERFTMLRTQYQQYQSQQQQENPVDDVRRSMAAAQRQDSRNQRLLLQMERRPTLLAALKIKQKSLRQRLGPNRVGYSGRPVDRLSIPTRTPLARPRGVRPLSVGLRGRSFRPQPQFSPARPQRAVGRTRQIVRKTPQTNLPRGRSLLAMDNTPRFQTRPQFQTQNRNQFQTQNRNQFQTRRPLNRSQFQNKTQFQPQNQGRFQNQARTQNQPRTQSQNQFRQNNQNRNQFQTQRRGQNQPRSGRPGNTGPQTFNKGRGNRNFKGNQGNQNQRNQQQGNRPQGGSFRRNQGRGRNGRQGPKPTKEELDLQLDQYMASTKSSLDKELDSYMNQSDT